MTDVLPPVTFGVEFVAESPPKKQHSRALMGWMISGIIHLVLLVLIAVMVVAAPKLIEQDAPPLRVIPIEAPAPKVEKPKTERTLEPKIELDAPTEIDVQAPVSKLDVPNEVAEKEAETDSSQPKGREEAIAEAETGGSGAFMAVGTGGGSAGMFGNRSGGGRKRAVGVGGGSKGSEGAVEAGLRWFVKHQAPNGSWPLLTYQNNCSEAQKCEPAERHRGPSDDIGVTSLAVLCFLGAGYDHKVVNRYRPVVRKAIDWLLSQQSEEGEWKIEGARAHNYAQAMAVMALAEAYGMTTDPLLRKPVENGVRVMLARRVPVTARGKYPWTWGDGQESSAEGMATSATSWNLQALKAALGAGIATGDGWESGKQWLQAIWEGSVRAEGKDPAKLNAAVDETGISYRYNPVTGEIHNFRGAVNGPPGTNRGSHDLGCIGLLCAIFQGRLAGDTMIETLANYEMHYHLPTSYPMNNYYSYYNTLSMFQLGGPRWQKWNSTVRDLLVNSQIQAPGSCPDGSWNPGVHYSAEETGRPLATALNILSLEVYYRYAQVKGHDVGAH